MDENSMSESEVSPKEIINQMKLNIFNNSLTYNNSLINLDYLLHRPSILALIRKISNQIGFKSQTYFLSIYYLDIIHLKYQKINLDLKLLSLSCLLLSAKYVENDQNVPNLPIFVAIFNSFVEYRDIITSKELNYGEVLCCKLLEYKLNYYTIYDFDSFFFSHGIIKIEQLKEINNEKKLNNNENDYINNNNSDTNENPFDIRKILEKIYRISRQYLDKIINNGNICLKYNSLIISVVIMKKSVEDILIKEQKIKEEYLNDFKEKASKSFKEIMLDIYQIDYESMEEYQKLISDNDLQNIFKNKRIYKYISDNNLEFENNKQIHSNINNNKYQNIFNKTIHGNLFIKKLDLLQNPNYIFIKNNESLVNSEEGDMQYSNKIKKERISVPKGINLARKYAEISNLNSTFSKNYSISKKMGNHLCEGKNVITKIRKTSLYKKSELNDYANYMYTYTKGFYPKKRKDSNSTIKKSIRQININENDSHYKTKDYINTMENNLTMQNDNDLDIVDPEESKNYIKYQKLALRKKLFNQIIDKKINYFSISKIDDSNILQNMNIFDKKIQMNNLTKPYYKKVIKNITNYTIKPNIKVNTLISDMNKTINNNMYNPSKRKQNKMILLNPMPSFNNTLDNELAIDSENYSINNINNENKRNLVFNKNKIIILDKQNITRNYRKKLLSNNILENSMTIDINDNKSKENKENNNILSSTNKDYFNKKNERKKLLFMRMRNINNKLNYKNLLGDTEIKNINQISKRKFLVPNNKIKKEEIENNNINNKERIYENQIMNKNLNEKRNINNNNNILISKEMNQKSLRYKFITAKNFEENKPVSDSNKILPNEIKKEKTYYPNSKLFKLINKTKNLNENKLNLSKEEINSAFIQNFKKDNYKNKIMKNMQILDFNKTKDNIETKKIPNSMFNTINNDDIKNIKNDNTIENTNDTNRNTIHNYHYRNYMKNKIKKNKEKEKERDKNKIENTNNENPKTIVINNNININFNNKIEKSNIYERDKNEIGKKQATTKMSESKEFFSKIIMNKNSNMNNNFHSNGTLEYKNINQDNIKNSNITSLLHRIPFYKKSSENYKNKLSRDNSQKNSN